MFNLHKQKKKEKNNSQNKVIKQIKVQIYFLKLLNQQSLKKILKKYFLNMVQLHQCVLKPILKRSPILMKNFNFVLLISKNLNKQKMLFLHVKEIKKF